MGQYKLYKCANPHCGELFKLCEIKYAGGINDKGWLIIRCKNCGAEMKLQVNNPNEYYPGTFPNAEILKAVEMDEIATGEIFYDKISRYPEPESCIVLEDKARRVEWKPLRVNAFWRTGGYDEIECQYYFTISEKFISKAIRDFRNYYLAGQYRKELPSKIVVLQSYSNHKLLWAKEVYGEADLNEKNLYLVHYNKQVGWPDGVYERDILITYLERCLMRWNILANQVVVVTPFIGFQYKNRKMQENVLGLWEFLDSRLNMDKTFFVTRTETKNLLKKTQSDIDVPIEVLREWHLMNRLQETVEKQKLKLKSARFHAKFYAGVFDNHVEVLSGSYNIHTGKGREQVVMNQYSLEKFKKNYMDQLVDGFEYQNSVDEDVLFFEVSSKSYNNLSVKSFSKVIRIVRGGLL